MLARANLYQDFRICYNCRLNAVSRTCHFQQTWPATAIRSFTASCRRKQEHLDDPQAESQTYQPRIRELQFRHGKLRRTKSRRLNLHEDRIPLPIQALGEPAAIRVVRDKPRPPKEQVQARSEPLQKELLEEFLKDATAKAGVLSDEEVVESIHQLHKAFKEKIGEDEDPYLEECRALGDTLSDGFTASQLRAYIDQVGAAVAVQPDDLNAMYKGQSYARSGWFVGESSFPEDARRRLSSEVGTSIDEGYFIMRVFRDDDGTVRQTKKAALIEQVLRRCWALRVREEKESPGSVDVWMNVTVLDVMLKHNDEIFNKISEAHNVKMNVAPTLGLLRISGAYEVCRLALEALIRYLSHVVFKTINLGPKAREILKRSETSLQQIEDLTKTRVVPGRGEKIDIFYLGPKSTGLEDARRFIYQLREYVEKKPLDVDCYPHDIANAFIPMDVTSLGLIERQHKWYRWRERDLTAKAPSGLLQLTMPAADSLIIKDMKEKLRTAWATTENEHWVTRSEQTVSATFGSICHAIPSIPDVTRELDKLGGSRADIKENKKGVLGMVTGYPRALVTSFPDMLTAINNLVSDSPAMANTVSISMKPDNPSSPDLELTVRLDGGRQTTELDGVNLIYNTKVTDLLLPVQPVDVRFSSRASFAAKPDKFDPAILTFLANSNLDIWGNERLMTPQKLLLKLPKYEMGQTTPQKLLLKQPKDKMGQTAQQPIEEQYSFSNLSVCSYMKTLVQGFPLILSTIEAGKSGGRRDELKLVLEGYAAHTGDSETSQKFDDDIIARWDNEFLMWYAAVKTVASRILH